MVDTKLDGSDWKTHIIPDTNEDQICSSADEERKGVYPIRSPIDVDVGGFGGHISELIGFGCGDPPGGSTTRDQRDCDDETKKCFHGGQVGLDFLLARFSVAEVPQTDVQEKGIMNARAILDSELRKKVAHLDVEQIRVLTAQLEQDVLQLKIFLKVAGDKKFYRRRPASDHVPPRQWN